MNPLLVIAPATLLFMVVVFTIIMSTVSVASGWGRLAKAYPCERQVVGTTWSWQSAELRRGMNYSGCLTFTANAEGLGLTAMLFFRMGHRPLFFPWADVTIERKRRMFGMVSVCLHFAREPDVPLMISRRLAGKIQAAVGPAWPERLESDL